MNKAELLALYDQDQRRNINYPGMRREVTANVVRHIDGSEIGEGMISYSQLHEGNVDQVIGEQIEYFESLGQDFEWKVYDYDTPPNLQERLKSNGLIVEEPEAVMVLDLDSAPDLFWQPVRHKVQRITNVEKLADVQMIEQQVWDEDASWVLHLLGDALNNHPERMSVYAAYVNEQPASAAWIYFPENSQFASLWGGATISRFRKQGLFTALLAVRAQEAKARQVRFLTVDAMPMSRPILEKVGFAMIAYAYPCKWKGNSNFL
ncbi:MAG: N-acetyltransferase [Anaerolineae bacterium]|nr:N-acetyltransferase [Anaerolineae bacterium]